MPQGPREYTWTHRAASADSGLQLNTTQGSSRREPHTPYLEDGGSGRKERGGAVARALRGPEGRQPHCLKEKPAGGGSSWTTASSRRLENPLWEKEEAARIFSFLTKEKQSTKISLILGSCQTARKRAFGDVKQNADVPSVLTSALASQDNAASRRVCVSVGIWTWPVVEHRILRLVIAGRL